MTLPRIKPVGFLGQKDYKGESGVYQKGRKMKKVKIVITLTDATLAANIGGDAEKKASIIELADDQIPSILKSYLEYPTYQAVSFSLLVED